MASSVVVVVLLHFIFEQCLLTRGSMHWVVTEDGRVQSQTDSVFNLKRPYDLVAFMKQEDRATVLNNLKKELLNRKGEINKSDDRDTASLEQKFYRTDFDCLNAYKPLPEYDLYISTVLPLENKGIRPEDFIDLHALPSDEPIAPDCTKVSDLDFSPHSFEHLEGVKDRHNLTGTPELGLKSAITHQDNVDDYGHLVYEAFKHNKTSWVLYNMAAFYWRIKGDPYQAVECVRRALHYSPRSHKDVALISLGNILHRARFSNEAAIVVHSALEISKELNVNHFTLGNVYAVLGEYNKSVICFENTLKIQPDFDAAARRKYAVLCHSKLESALEAQHKSLQKTLNDLKDYQKKHDLWQQHNEKLLKEQVSTEEKTAQNMAFEASKVRLISPELGQYCNMVDREGKQVLLCTWNRRNPTLEMMDQHAMEEQKKEQAEKDGLSNNKQQKKAIDYNLPVRAPLYVKDRRPVPRYEDSEQAADSWPSKEECDTHVQKVPDPKNLSTVYLSPENKGFEVKALLSDAQNLKENSEHPLPWYPPICVTLLNINDYDEKTYDNIKSVADRTKVPLKMSDPSMRKLLLSHVNDGSVTEEEVGQRILSAIKQEVGARWVLFNLAGLYWRVIGNNYHGIECIRRSLALAPDEYADVPLVNMANILYKWGRFDDALLLMKDALKLNDAEPDTNFLFGNLLWATKNYTGAVAHYRIVLDIVPEHQEALSALRALRCYQKYHEAAQSVAPVETLAQPVGNNCQQKGVATNNPQTESRVICKTENGEEKCIIETRTRGKAGDCNGHCTQTCTITPIKLEACNGGELPMDTSRPLEISCSVTAQSACDKSQTDPVQCHQKGNHQCGGDGGEELLFTNDFTAKLDEVSEHYEKKGICEGDDCNTLRVQCLLPMKTHSGLLAHVITPPKLFVRPVALHSTQCMTEKKKPQIKLEFVNGVLHQRYIFVDDKSNVHVEEDDCFIFNDDTKSPGCNLEKYRTYKAEVITTPDIFVEMKYKERDGNTGEVRHYSVTSLRPDTPDEYRTDMIAMQLEHWTWFRRKELELWEELHCDTLKKYDFKHFESTYTPFDAEDVNIHKYIDFKTMYKHDLEEPECPIEKVVPQLARDHIVQLNDKVKYKPESSIAWALKNLGGAAQPVPVVGHRIALALQKNDTNWVAAVAAGLYWRVEGDFQKAVNCYRLALTFAPRNLSDYALAGYANIFTQGKLYYNAIISIDMALEIRHWIPTYHFMIGNAFAAIEQYPNAAAFYETSRFYMPDYRPSTDRLKAFYCQRVKHF